MWSLKVPFGALLALLPLGCVSTGAGHERGADRTVARRTPVQLERPREARSLGVSDAGPATEVPTLIVGVRRVFLMVFLNGEKTRDAVVTLDGDDALIEVSLARELGLVANLSTALPRGPGETCGPAQDLPGMPPQLSLACLRGHLDFVVDEAAVALRIEARPELFDAHLLRFAAGRPVGIVDSQDLSALFNWGVRADFDDVASFFGEPALRIGPVLIHSTFDVGTETPFKRGLSRLILDDTARVERWTLGDTYQSTGELGANLPLAGLTVEKSFDLAPYTTRAPGLDFEGAATTPSRLDVYVDGVLTRRVEVAPGNFRIEDLPVPRGSGVATFVLRDALGNEQRFARPYQIGRGVLAPGVDDYAFSLGLRRERFASSSFAYGEPVALTRYRRGMTRDVTVGLRAESAPLRAMASGGASATISLPLGVLQLGVGTSTVGGTSGVAGYVGYEVIGREANASVYGIARSDRYVTLDLGVADERSLLSVGASTAWSRGPFRVALEGRADLPRDAVGRFDVRVSSAFQIASSVELRLEGATRGALGRRPVDPSLGDSEGWSAQAVLAFAPSSGVSIGVSGAIDDDGARGGVVANVPMHGENGVAFNSSATWGHGLRLNAQSRLQSDFGRANLHLGYGGARGLTGSVEAAGALSWVEGTRVHISRPIQGSWAVVEVPSGVKVRVLRENRSIGESSSGETLVPDLMPYYGNRLSLATRELALGLELEASERVVAPPYRGGARVTFQLVRARYVRGVLVLESDGSAPAFGTLTIMDAGSTQDAGAASSPVGAEGEFELAGLGAGLHRGEVEYAGGRCVVVLIVPSDAAPIVTIGRVLCQAPTAVTP